MVATPGEAEGLGAEADPAQAPDPRYFLRGGERPVRRHSTVAPFLAQLRRLVLLLLRLAERVLVLRFRDVVERFRELLLFRAAVVRPPVRPATRTVVRPLPVFRDEVCLAAAAAVVAVPDPVPLPCELIAGGGLAQPSQPAAVFALALLHRRSLCGLPAQAAARGSPLGK